MPLHLPTSITATLAFAGEGGVRAFLPFLFGLLAVALGWAVLRWGRFLERRLGKQQIQSAQNRVEELEAKQDEAAAQGQMRSELLSAMARELRPPLNAILLYTELIEDHARETEDSELQSDSASIRAAAQHLRAQLGNLLDLARLEAGNLDLTVEPVTLESLCLDVERTVEPLTALRGNALEVEVPAFAVAIPSDRSRLQQILVSLLAEASRGCERETILLRVSQDPALTRFRIVGGSLGLTYRQTQLLLERAEHEDSMVASATQFEHGLGLALGARLARLLGGRILQPSDGGILLLELPTTRSGRTLRKQAETTA